MVSLFIIIFSILSAVVAAENKCIFQDTCERCLAADINCAWCTDKMYELRHRCLRREQLIANGCATDEIYENEPKMLTLKDIAVKDYESVNDRAIQVQPQRVYLKLVKGKSETIKLTYRPARSNPLDLYVLMDLTWTMRDDKETLVKLGSELSTALRNLTVNYRLGFGSFADKPAMPMIMEPLRENPCASEQGICVPTYGFKHHLGLTDNVTSFVNSVNSSRITGNLDNLEGGLDALMQVLVCTEEIGWREEARKIVILVTDGFMHLAGDGKLAGVTRRNDKQCHLNTKGDYSGSLQFDYPSLEEIYRELTLRKVNIIFAVTAPVVNTYHQMSNLMIEISNVEILSADSSNILELIKKSYLRFIKRTQFTDNSPDFIQINYETDCGGQYTNLKKRNYCNNIALGTTVDFYVNITLTDFPQQEAYSHNIRIEESSLNEHMEMEVQIQRPCPCTETPEPNNEYGRFQCTEHGYLHCGMCNCDEGWTGKYCSCSTDPTNATTTVAIENLCRPSLTDMQPLQLGEICSNQGECDCGTCVCFEGFRGTFCECGECSLDCDRKRADCFCGKCVCKEGWSGEECNCRESVEGCIGPTGELCSFHGHCECNTCKCDNPYLGKFCEIGLEMDNKLCTFFEPCVTCLIEQKIGLGTCENLTDICSTINDRERFTYEFVTEDIEVKIRCLVRLENKHGIKCDHYFTYQSLSSTENYLVIQANTCDPLNYYALFGSVAFFTVLIGLLLIFMVWCCIKAKDAREYSRFEKDQRNSVLNESPLYKDPITRYKVPDQLNSRKSSNPFL